MKKLLLIPLLLLSCCKNNGIPDRTLETYDEGLTQEELFEQAAELKGIGVINIGDTYKTIERNLTEHNKQFRNLYNGNGLIKSAYTGKLPTFWRDLNIHNSTYVYDNDNDYNKSHYDQRKSVKLIITPDFAVDLALFFFNDTLYKIEAKNKERELANLFAEKYGEGSGAYIIDKRPNLKITEDNESRKWENETVKASYYRDFCNFKDDRDFRNGSSDDFTIESKTIDKNEIYKRNNEIKEKIKAEKAERHNEVLNKL